MLDASKENRDAIVARWLEKMLELYFPQSRAFFLEERDRFRNPVGATLREQLPVIVEEILGKMDLVRLCKALEAIVRIRAVQDIAPGQAIAFLFQLKDVFRDRRSKLHGPSGSQSLLLLDGDRWVMERRIDESILLAFDMYMKCREKIYEVKAEEAKRRVAQLERIYQGAERGGLPWKPLSR